MSKGEVLSMLKFGADRWESPKGSTGQGGRGRGRRGCWCWCWRGRAVGQRRRGEWGQALVQVREG